MSSTRARLQLDEHSFQGLLAAAFTIQEHNDKLKRASRAKPKPDPSPKPDPETKKETGRVCWHCAAPLKEGESRCHQCGLEEFRPGERMQRKWASLWEMTREQGMRQERLPGDSRECAVELASSGFAALPEISTKTVAPPEDLKEDREYDHPELSTGQTDTPVALEQHAPLAPRSSAAPSSVALSSDNDVSLTEASTAAADPVASSFWDLRRKLPFDRADLYLGVSILVAALALLWPAPTIPHKQSLPIWERMLVNMGIAEAPTPAVHYGGNPNVEVWVDPHSALYYCPGEQPYGNTPDGRLSSQRDAQVEQFEPAGRRACD